MVGVKQFNQQETLDKATALFRRKGFTATSMQDIVEELGISRGSLYQTFGNKQDLYIAALKNYGVQRQQMAQQVISKATSAKEGVQLLLHHIVELSQGEEGRHGCMIGNTIIERSIHDSESEQIVTQVILENISILSELFQEAKEEGDFPKDKDPVKAAQLLQTGMQGITLMGVALPEPNILLSIADELFNSLFQ